MWPAPSERPPCPRGSQPDPSASLRGLLPPLDPPLSPCGPLLRSVPHARGVRSLIPPLRSGGCYPPWTPSLSMWPAPSERPTCQGGSQPDPSASLRGLLPPLDPLDHQTLMRRAFSTREN